MAQDWGNWIELAEHELEETRGALAAGLHQMVAFFSHQIAEAALKALWIHAADGLPPRTHDLVKVATELEAPEGVIHSARLLNPLYRGARYPDAANGNPGKNFDEAISGDLLSAAEDMLRWCTARLPRRTATLASPGSS